MAPLSRMVPLPHTVIEVETVAARRALELAAELGFDNLVFEGDSNRSSSMSLRAELVLGSIWTPGKRHYFSSLAFFSFKIFSFM